MKVLMIYFTMGGRTKKVAETIVSVLSEYEVSYVPFEITGKFLQKIKVLDKFENGDFSTIEDKLNKLDAEVYDLVLIGMPTYGNRPPKVFDEILKRIKNLKDKKVVVFSTARITGDENIEDIKSEIENKNAKVIESHNFKGFFRIRRKSVLKFAENIIS